nr:hypothetical protein [Pandoravirus massiliensis]
MVGALIVTRIERSTSAETARLYAAADPIAFVRAHAFLFSGPLCLCGLLLAVAGGAALCICRFAVPASPADLLFFLSFFVAVVVAVRGGRGFCSPEEHARAETKNTQGRPPASVVPFFAVTCKKTT